MIKKCWAIVGAWLTAVGGKLGLVSRPPVVDENYLAFMRAQLEMIAKTLGTPYPELAAHFVCRHTGGVRMRLLSAHRSAAADVAAGRRAPLSAVDFAEIVALVANEDCQEAKPETYPAGVREGPLGACCIVSESIPEGFRIFPTAEAAREFARAGGWLESFDKQYAGFEGAGPLGVSWEWQAAPEPDHQTEANAFHAACQKRMRSLEAGEPAHTDDGLSLDDAQVEALIASPAMRKIQDLEDYERAGRDARTQVEHYAFGIAITDATAPVSAGIASQPQLDPLTYPDLIAIDDAPAIQPYQRDVMAALSAGPVMRQLQVVEDYEKAGRDFRDSPMATFGRELHAARMERLARQTVGEAAAGLGLGFRVVDDLDDAVKFALSTTPIQISDAECAGFDLVQEMKDDERDRAEFHAERQRGSRKPPDPEWATLLTDLTPAEVGAELAKLREFKRYVHARLDAAGVPHDPEPVRNAEHGCRIGGRLDWMLKYFQPPTLDRITLQEWGLARKALDASVIGDRRQNRRAISGEFRPALNRYGYMAGNHGDFESANYSRILVGPKGCGKTTNAARIAHAFGLGSVYDGWPSPFEPGHGAHEFQKYGALYIAEVVPQAHGFARHVVTFDDAMDQVRAYEMDRDRNKVKPLPIGPDTVVPLVEYPDIGSQTPNHDEGTPGIDSARAEGAAELEALMDEVDAMPAVQAGVIVPSTEGYALPTGKPYPEPEPIPVGPLTYDEYPPLRKGQLSGAIAAAIQEPKP